MYLSGREEVVESLVKRKKEAYVKMRHEGSVSALESYKLARKDRKRELRRARRGLEKSLAGRIKENPIGMSGIKE